MSKLLTIAVVSLLAGAVLAGCTTQPGNKPTTSTTTPGGATEAIVAHSPAAPRVAEAVSFDAQGATSSDTVRWQFGDGTNATGKTASHAYASPGAYIVRLEIENSRGTVDNEGTLTFVTVAGNVTEGPSAVLILDRQVISKGGNVTADGTGSYVTAANADFNATIGETPDNPRFTRDAAGTANLTFEIDWGDGTKDTASNGTHTYANSGLYVVTLTARTPSGPSAKAAGSVLVLSEGQPVGGYKNKDLYVEATISGPQSFDPGFDYETAGGHIIEQVYDTLFGTERGNTERIVPVLAAEVPTVANGGIRENGTVYVIKLRPNVKFHDGTPFNAAAVKFSLDRAILMNDPSSGAPVLAPILKGAVAYRDAGNNTQADRDAWLALEAVKVVDDLTVQITMDRPNAAFFQRLAFYGTSIVSPTAFKACHQERVPLWGVCQTPDGLPPAATAGGRSITRDPWADTNMVGTGPFKLRTWLPGDRVILDRNDDYWGDKAKLKTVIVQYVDDLNTRILMLKSGDADEIYISSADLDRVKPSIQDIARFTPADTLIIDAFFFNYDIEDPNECPTVSGSADCKAFQDIHLRKALAHAFDYQTFFTQIWNGRAKDLAGVIPRGMPGYNESLQPYKHDVELAKAELAQSKAKDGLSMSCTYNAGNTVRKGACELFKKNVEELNPGKNTVTVRELPFNTLLDKTQGQQIPFWILGWSPDYIATDDYIEPFLHSRGNYPVQQNFKDAELDELIDRGIRETDPVKQAQIFAQANAMGVAKYVDIFLDQRTQTHVERTYVQGYYYSPLHSGSPNTGDYSVTSKA